MRVKKFTHGYITQVFDENGRFICQEFMATGRIVWWTNVKEKIISKDDFEHPFDMVNSEPKSKKKGKKK